MSEEMSPSHFRTIRREYRTTEVREVAYVIDYFRTSGIWRYPDGKMYYFCSYAFDPDRVCSSLSSFSADSKGYDQEVALYQSELKDKVYNKELTPAEAEARYLRRKAEVDSSYRKTGPTDGIQHRALHHDPVRFERLTRPCGPSACY